MLQRRGELDLLEEPLGAEHGGELRVQHLDRDVAVVAQVAREVDRRHAAAPSSRSSVIRRAERLSQCALCGFGPDRLHRRLRSLVALEHTALSRAGPADPRTPDG